MTIDLMSDASQQADNANFSLSSPDIVNGRLTSAQFGTGGNVSPELSWTGAPEGTKSFVVSMYDKDAPTGSGFWHWVVINLTATSSGIASGAADDATKLPFGAIQTLNDASFNGYVGIAPPKGGTHDYLITVKALGIEELPVDQNSTGAMVGYVSNMNVLATATLIAKGGN